MLPGFNHNVRHEGALFHVQTEDSGIQHAMVVTHLFLGGNILATRRTSYEKFAKKASMKEIVLAIMQEQHKEVMKDLVHGRISSVQDHLGKPKVPKTLPEKARDPRRPRPAPGIATFDTSALDEKTLDEMIMEFLSSDEPKKK